MNILATTTISPIDLINFSQSIAQLNLCYLGISVVILGVLGGVFVYFNIKPLKETLEKQEKTIEELRKQAQGLLTLSAEQSEKALQDFAAGQSKLLTIALEQQEGKLNLQTINKIQEIEKIISDKIEKISESKDLKLKDFILAEVSSRSAHLEKETTSKITSVKEDLAKEVSALKSKDAGLKTTINAVDEKVKELQVYKYSKEGQMGAIIVSIDLLKEAIGDYFKNKEMIMPHESPESFGETFGWKVKMRLEELIKEIDTYTLEEDYISQIKTELGRIANEAAFHTLIDELKIKLGI